MSDIVIGEFEIVAEAPGMAPPEPQRDAAPVGELRLNLADLALLQRRLQDDSLRVWAG